MKNGGLEGVCLDIATVALRTCSVAGLSLSGLCVAEFDFGGAGGGVLSVYGLRCSSLPTPRRA
jgi:hypothetical protein